MTIAQPENTRQGGSYELSKPMLQAPSVNKPSEMSSPLQGMPASTRSSSPIRPAKPWSLTPQSLLRRGWLETLKLVADVALTFLPLIFLAFAAVGARLDGQPASAWGDKVRRAANLGPTVFPILFAVIVRRMVREGARWRAQRGAPLGALEELLGSASIFGTIETQFLLRSCSITGVLLFALWALSPVGGQASLLLISVRPSPSVGTRSVWYGAKDMQTYKSAFASGSGLAMYRTNMQALFQASLIAPETVLEGPEDTWGNVKVPHLETLNASTADRDGWITVPRTNVTYSSLLGVPVYPRQLGAESNMSIHFTVETQYFTLDCPVLQNTSCHSLANGSSFQTKSSGPASCKCVGADDRFGCGWFIFVTNSSWSSRNSAGHVTWQSRGSPCTQGWCSLALSLVESNVTCGNVDGKSAARSGCRVSHVRRSRRARYEADQSPFHTFLTLRSFWDYWSEMNIMTRSNIHSLTEYFLWSGSGTPAVMDVLKLYTLSPSVFSQRLTICWNTLWQAGVASQYYTSGLPSNASAYALDEPTRKLVGWSKGILLVNETLAKTVSVTPSYRCEKHWLVLLIAASSALLLSGALGFWAKYTAVAPDILAYASSLTRNNPFIPLPAGGSTLDGMERARALKRVRVRLRDVQPDAPVGHIALALDDAPTAGGTVDSAATSSGSCLSGSSDDSKLLKRRLYA